MLYLNVLYEFEDHVQNNFKISIRLVLNFINNFNHKSDQLETVKVKKNITKISAYLDVENK